jgi:hypothetical protein
MIRLKCLALRFSARNLKRSHYAFFCLFPPPGTAAILIDSSPAVRGKKRGRIHGGAPGSNALKHGVFTCEAIKQIRELIRGSRDLLQKIEVRANRTFLLGTRLSELVFANRDLS